MDKSHFLLVFSRIPLDILVNNADARPIRNRPLTSERRRRIYAICSQPPPVTADDGFPSLLTPVRRMHTGNVFSLLLRSAKKDRKRTIGSPWANARVTEGFIYSWPGLRVARGEIARSTEECWELPRELVAAVPHASSGSQVNFSTLPRITELRLCWYVCTSTLTRFLVRLHGLIYTRLAYSACSSFLVLGAVRSAIEREDWYCRYWLVHGPKKNYCAIEWWNWRY